MYGTLKWYSFTVPYNDFQNQKNCYNSHSINDNWITVNVIIDNNVKCKCTISSNYNMGLTASVSPLPSGQLLTEAFSTPSRLYFYALGWIDDYPWVVDFLGPMFAPAQAYTGSGGWNLTQMADLYQQAVVATEKNNVT